MKVDISLKDPESLFPTDIVFQTHFWSRVKSRLGWKARAFNISSSGVEGDVLVLTRNLENGVSVAYVPQGPERGPEPEEYGSFLENLSDKLMDHIDPRTAFIRYDLPWVSPYTEQNDNYPGKTEWPLQPEPRLQEIRMNFGTNSWNLRKAVTDLTVADAVHVDLCAKEDEILSRMKPKTRYNIRLSEKKGVKVFFASKELLPVFYKLYCETAGRNKFPVCGYEHFSSIFSSLTDGHNAPECHFLLAAHGGRHLAGAIVIISGRTATFLFGASSSENRHLMGSYAIQWGAIRLAMARGCRVYDMGAVAPTDDPEHPFFGMFRFKTGFGGKVIHRSGSWDYPLLEDKYMLFRNRETIGRMHLTA